MENQEQQKEKKPKIVQQHIANDNVLKLMKETLNSKKDDSQIKISEDSREMVQECVTELLHFITGEAFHKAS